MSTTQEIMQFALHRKFGLNFDSTDQEIRSVFGKPEIEYDNEISPFMHYGDLEIGLVRKSDNQPDTFRKIAYFKFCVGATSGSRTFKIPGTVDLKFKVADADIREVMQVLVNHSVWFEHVYRFHSENTRGLQTLDQRNSFHFIKKRGRWLLDCYFSGQI